MEKESERLHTKLYRDIAEEFLWSSQEFKSFKEAIPLDPRDKEEHGDSAIHLLNIWESRGGVSLGNYKALIRLLRSLSLHGALNMAQTQTEKISLQLIAENDLAAKAALRARDPPAEEPGSLHSCQNDFWESEETALSTDENLLIESVRNHDWETVIQLTSRGVDVRIKDNNGCPLLHIACLNTTCSPGNFDTIKIVENLLSVGADPNGRNREGRTALHVVLRTPRSDSRVVKLLLEAGISPGERDEMGQTPLMWACIGEDPAALDSVTMLVDYKCDVFTRDDLGNSALHHICKNKHLDVYIRNDIALKFLLRGVSANVALDKTDYPCTPLMAALFTLKCCSQHSDAQDWQWLLVETLIQAGSKIRLQTVYNKNMMTFFVTNANKFSTRLLEISWSTYSIEFLELLPELTGFTDPKTMEFCNEIRRLSKIVRSLKELCRTVVRDVLDGKVLFHAPSLPLPRQLQQYITLGFL